MRFILKQKPLPQKSKYFLLTKLIIGNVYCKPPVSAKRSYAPDVQCSDTGTVNISVILLILLLLHLNNSVLKW